MSIFWLFVLLIVGAVLFVLAYVVKGRHTWREAFRKLWQGIRG